MGELLDFLANLVFEMFGETILRALLHILYVTGWILFYAGWSAGVFVPLYLSGKLGLAALAGLTALAANAALFYQSRNGARWASYVSALGAVVGFVAVCFLIVKAPQA